MLPSARLAGEYQSLRTRAKTTDTHASMAMRSTIDWILPVDSEKVCSMLMVLIQLCADRSSLFTQANPPTLGS